jgi:hypothetical protein
VTTKTLESNAIEFSGLLLSLPPEWDASTPERLSQVRDELASAAEEHPGYKPLLERFFEFAGTRRDLLIAWLLMPLTDEHDDVRGLLFATLVGGVVEDAEPWSADAPATDLGPWRAIRRTSRHKEQIDQENSLDVLIVQYEVALAETQRLVCECRSPNVFLADELTAHFDEIVSSVRLVPESLAVDQGLMRATNERPEP